MFKNVKLVFLLSMVSSYTILCSSIEMSEFNETKAILVLQSELADLKLDRVIIRGNQSDNSEELKVIRSEQKRQGDMLKGILGKLDQVTRYIDGSYGRDCDMIKLSGIHEIIIPSYSNLPFKVNCDATTQGGGWTILLRRMDGSVDFYRNWTEYKNGFGDLDGEFFLGLDKIHALTADKKQELMFIVEDFKGAVKNETYEEFAIGDELAEYVLHTLGKAKGTAGDNFTHHFGQKFTTFDRDNDMHEYNCAEMYTGAWWYKQCHWSNLAGKYNDTSLGKGVNWGDSFYSFKRAVMMIRPKKN